MTVINDADEVFLGTTAVDEVYMDGVLVWSAVAPMAMPFRVGVSAVHYANGTTTITLTVPPGVQQGDLVIMACTATGITDVPAPTGWTVLCPINTVNTRKFVSMARVYQTGDPASYSFPVTGSGARTAQLVVVRGGPTSISGLVVGTAAKRAASGTVTTAPGVTAPASSLVLSIFGEATTPDEAANFYPTYSNGFISWDYARQSGTGNIETVAWATKEYAVAGATGVVTATYPNASLNGVGFQVAIPGSIPA